MALFGLWYIVVGADWSSSVAIAAAAQATASMTAAHTRHTDRRPSRASMRVLDFLAFSCVRAKKTTNAVKIDENSHLPNAVAYKSRIARTVVVEYRMKHPIPSHRTRACIHTVARWDVGQTDRRAWLYYGCWVTTEKPSYKAGEHTIMNRQAGIEDGFHQCGPGCNHCLWSVWRGRLSRLIMLFLGKGFCLCRGCFWMEIKPFQCSSFAWSAWSKIIR